MGSLFDITLPLLYGKHGSGFIKSFVFAATVMSQLLLL